MSAALKKGLPDGFTVTAHSGSEGTSDNSMEFLVRCMELKVAVLEIDVTFRRDGTPAVIHKELADDDEGMLLDEAIAYIAKSSDTARVNLDLKSVENLPAVTEILDRYSMRERCFYTGVGENFAEAVRRDGGLPYYLNYNIDRFKRRNRAALETALSKVKNAGAIGINCHHKSASAQLVKLFHDNGLLVSCWTANTEAVMKRLIKIKPDNITTRYPVKLSGMIYGE